MHQHGPTDLTGPVRGSGSWWRGTGAEPPDSGEGTGTKVRNKRSRKQKKAPHDEGIRKALVERVRGEIAAGTYDTPEKWEAALERLLDRLERE